MRRMYSAKIIIRSSRLSRAVPDSTYYLADVTAFGNSHENPPKGVIELNVAGKIKRVINNKYGKTRLHTHMSPRLCSPDDNVEAPEIRVWSSFITCTNL